MKRRFYIAFFIITLSLTANDNLRLQYDYANQLFNQEEYFSAITEFKRLQFFDTENIYTFEANYKIGRAYKKGGFYDNAIEYLSKAKFATQNSEEQAEADFQIIRCNILRGTFQRSLQLLDELEKEKHPVKVQNKIHYWRGWTYMLDNKWNLASESFGNISENHELKILCEQVENDKYSVTFARVISYILPGAGQFYTGNYFSGFMSLAWNVLWGYLAINAFAADRVFDGAAVGSMLWLRFYRGNIQNAGKLAENENKGEKP
jgi:tetratricopeptide (TPR) repeat protein